MRKYKTILADPPWLYNDVGRRGSATNHYSQMTVKQISELPIKELAEDNAHLWLWVTNHFMFEQIETMKAWGFKYKGCLTWIKPYYGVGSYLRGQTEHLLLGVRGKCPPLFKGQGTWFYGPKQEHSHKPEEQYAIIERFSPGPYLELFARRKQPNWDVWGNEVESDINLTPRD